MCVSIVSFCYPKKVGNQIEICNQTKVNCRGNHTPKINPYRTGGKQLATAQAKGECNTSNAASKSKAVGVVQTCHGASLQISQSCTREMEPMHFLREEVLSDCYLCKGACFVPIHKWQGFPFAPLLTPFFDESARCNNMVHGFKWCR